MKQVTKQRIIKEGSRVEFASRNHVGRGTVARIDHKLTGAWFTVKTKDHPKGQVTVRASQVS